MQVREAGEDAWLGRPAPEDPELDCHSSDQHVRHMQIALLQPQACSSTAMSLPADGHGAEVAVKGAHALLMWPQAASCTAGAMVRDSFAWTACELDCEAHYMLAALRRQPNLKVVHACLPVSIGQVRCHSGRYSYRSLKEALEAARDGDQILLRRGIHNGLGYAC